MANAYVKKDVYIGALQSSLGGNYVIAQDLFTMTYGVRCKACGFGVGFALSDLYIHENAIETLQEVHHIMKNHKCNRTEKHPDYGRVQEHRDYVTFNDTGSSGVSGHWNNITQPFRWRSQFIDEIESILEIESDEHSKYPPQRTL